jgi:hypothetical protein
LFCTGMYLLNKFLYFSTCTIILCNLKSYCHKHYYNAMDHSIQWRL